MASIRDVAEKAGVSISTVSKVFNGYTDVNEKTKAHIFDVANQLDYTPNMAARTLSSKKQKTIALILNDYIFNKKTTMPMEVLSGVYRYTVSSEYEFVFYATSSENQEAKSFQQFCREHNITGVVIQGLKTTDRYYQEIQQTKVPVVLLDISVDNPNVGTVSIDNEAASQEAVNYLIELGHTAIGMINGGRNASVSMWREQGYTNALLNSNLVLADNLVRYADYDEDRAFEETLVLLQEHPEITGIFCASDIMAIGAMRAVQSLGLSVPEDISIIGFDNIVLTNYVVPKLSTVSQDMEKMGYEAAELLSNIIEHKVERIDRHRVSEHQLIIRESVKKIMR